MVGRAKGGPTNTQPQAQWRRPVIAALITVALVSLVILIGYARMREDAKSDAAAASSTRTAALKQAAANGREGDRGARQRPRAERSAAPRSR